MRSLVPIISIYLFICSIIFFTENGFRIANPYDCKNQAYSRIIYLQGFFPRSYWRYTVKAVCLKLTWRAGMGWWEGGSRGRGYTYTEWTPGAGDGQGGLECCNSWGRKESDTTERLNWTELMTDLCCCTAEINITLLSNYPPIQNKNKLTWICYHLVFFSFTMVMWLLNYG